MFEKSPDLPIPLVDFSAWTSRDTSSADRLAVARELVSACHTTGFAYVKNHGIPPELLQNAFERNKKFHDLPRTQRLQVRSDEKTFRGYSWPGREQASRMSENGTDDQTAMEDIMAVNVKEVYIIGNDGSQDAPNVWLPESVLPGFRAHANLLYQHCWSLSAQLLRAIALGLGFDDEDDLLKFHSTENGLLGFRHYPSVDAERANDLGVERLSTHRDFTPSITLLFQDDVGGLEIQHPDTEDGFVPVPPITDTLVMNVGDVLMYWTNDYLRSTVHRVTLPPVTTGASDAKGLTMPRYSIPYFANPKPDITMECLPLFCSKSNPQKYKPISYQEYVKEIKEKIYKA